MYGILTYKQSLNNSEDDIIARVIEKTNYIYTIITENEKCFKAETVTNLSTSDVFVGDFVTYTNFDNNYIITRVSPRTSTISKGTSHASKSYHVREQEQILAVNVEQVFILIAANQRFTLPKFERYVLTFYQQNVDLHILISKGDYTDLASNIMNKIKSVYPDFKVTIFSNLQKDTLTNIIRLFKKSRTSILLGSSGVGKSTLINELVNFDNVITNDVREDGKGKHTTTTTKMFYSSLTESYLIDSPGFKTISTTNEMDSTVLFQDIHDLALNCKFKDCTHTHEPKCAVLNAVENGSISEEYYNRYRENLRVTTGLLRHEQRKRQK